MLEKIYDDFTTQLLPKINEGLTITKDYFFELFGRYIKYLIVMDSIWMFIGLIGIVVCLRYAKRSIQWQRGVGNEFPVILIFIIPLLISLIIFFSNASNLVKDIFIPEIRVIEQINDYRNNDR